MTSPKDETEPVAEGTPLAELSEKPETASRERLPDQAAAMKALQLSPGLQRLWAAVLPIVGVRPSRTGEFAGYFQVEQGAAPDEALIHIDIPSEPYAEGAKPAMARVVSLSVKLAHDFRRLGDRYYCIDCEVPNDETRH
jgi:hypothetical protein